MTPDPITSPPPSDSGRTRHRLAIPILWLVLAIAVAWSYFGTFLGLVHQWWANADYQHCFLVPVVAAYLLWRRRRLMPAVGKGSSWGLIVLALAAMLRWASEYFYIGTFDPLSLIASAAGLVLLWGGFPAMRWAWPAVVVLIFMVPIPGTFAGLLSHPLQRIGAVASTYAIQTLGIPAVSQGNVIALADSSIGVVEACSGLRMLTLFIAVCTCAVFILPLRPIDRIFVLLSAPPIAVIANVFRITLTAVLHETVSHELADRVFHDMAGLLMMPLALALVLLETTLLKRLLLDKVGPMTIDTTDEIRNLKSEIRNYV